MKTISSLSLVLAHLLIFGISVNALSEDKRGDATMQLLPVSAEMTDGVIRKVDKNNKKITIRHGEIKNLDMPGMTMVFQVKHPDLLEKVQAGDKVKFRVEKSGSAFLVTDIQLDR